ncbi:DNA repair protein rad50 [Xylographa trunciseda]|nr:DNA repair protein rad50 [Xylographa trunciseda]
MIRYVGVTKIDKLLILGVRSFDNAHPEAIQFNTPLTLIVGYNGSGKTTIIECLKYATTGELPPNSKGGAFVHDPKLAGEKEVLAQVKLSFKSTSGAKMVATRSLQLTVKKSVRAQKTLDCTLLMVKNGERTTISSRVAELDQILPQYLGVSRAVLDSVIFCHQDESLWPMSEPSVLKKKFDEIFEALKYTKAIDNIKALRKKQNEELGKYKIMEQHAKEDKDKADKAEKKSKELHDEIEILRVETKDLHTKARDARDKSQEAFNQVASYTEVVESLKVARKNQEWYEKHLTDLAQDLKERSESDEWLQNELDQYEERMQIHDQRQKDQARRYEDVKREITQIRKSQSDKRVEAGKHEQRKIIHLKNIEDRNLEIKQTAKEHNIRGYDTELDDIEITEYIDKITKLSKDQNAKVERLRRENMLEIQKVQEVLDSLRERRSALQEGKKSAKDQMSANDKRTVVLYSELNKIAMDEGGKAALEFNIEDVESKLRKAKQDLFSGALDAKIEEVNAELRSLEDKNDALNKELIQGTKQAGNLARLDHLKKESKDRQRSLETMTGAHGERLRSIIGQSWQATTLEVDFQRVMESRKQGVKDAERQRDAITRDLEQLEFKLKTARADTKKKEGELQACAQILTEITNGEPEDYPEILAAIQNDRDTRKYDVDGYAILKKWYSECIETAKSKEPACRLCNRAFTEEKAIRLFVSKLENKVSKRALDELQRDLDDLNVELEKARDANTTYDTWRRLSETELPNLHTDVAQLERSRGTLLRQVEEHDKVVEEQEEARRDAETLSKPVANIFKYSNEYASYQRQIEELVAKQQDNGLSRTLEDLQDEIESNGARSRTLRASLIKLQNDDKRNRGQVSSFEIELSRSRSQLASATHELEKRTNILSQIEDVKNSNHEQRGVIAKLDGLLHSLAPQFSEQEAKRDDIKLRGETKEKELQKEARSLSESVLSLQRADVGIRAYIEDGGPSKLAKCQRDIQGFEQDITQLEAELKQITIEINKIREELANHDQNKRVINDNLKFRKTRRELEAVKVDIEKLSSQNAEADQVHYRIQAERFQRQHNLFSTEETSKMGIMKAKDDQLMQLLEDWNTDYKDAAYKFKKSHIEVETTKAAVEDLGRYGNALDKAIMKYHSLKMEEINRIIEELWKRTYQGTDVDTVLIRSDNETAKGNRSYNYRVCMLKQDVEMDMRGRCSAGQKVLACIIIRLALAECFGVNCGLIALDEPTTNLDRDNIKALAESLHYIIRSRQQQSNFQLIVITHDEDFLRYMKCADFCDTYYRVSRNDRQKSIIERQSIADVI